jgi:hypothetical protein
LLDKRAEFAYLRLVSTAREYGKPEIPESFTFNGRTFFQTELKLIQEVCSDFAALGRTEISRTVCELLEWKRVNGKVKNHECRLLLERLEERGWLQLPPVRHLGRRGPRTVEASWQGEPEAELQGSVGGFLPLWLEVVGAGAESQSRLWRELIERYHYLRCRVPVGANLRYMVRSERCPERVLACLLWTSAAWKMAARDGWIGWTDTQRRRNLLFIVNNSRFLILPWIRIRGLASTILSRCARQLPGDWEQRYGYRPALLETLVEAERFRGTCYRAANWIPLGPTQGRGRMDRHHAVADRVLKDIYVYPLRPDAREHLCHAEAPVFLASDPELL